MESEAIVDQMIDYRKRRRQSQFGLAMDLNISRSTLQRYEQRKTPLPLDVAEAFAKLLGKSLAELPGDKKKAPEDIHKQKLMTTVMDAVDEYMRAIGR